ncbi:MAG: succinylglutamate desuccinylase/aspartoacylase family protein [Spirochaetaceae bacterium]|jgi:predicted deacylase|nr:succinylglutamate desuccinylase/aspartoacylase family protein [Spirochaetaceae bacterium]
MIKTIVSEELPVCELLEIKKNIIQGERSGPRLCVVTGTHGDELEGQFVCFELARLLYQNVQHLCGNVEIYPALNPLGVDSISRGFPGFDLDMNRIFPGLRGGHIAENTVYAILEDLSGADLVLDIHSSNIFLNEVMQARISSDFAEGLIPYAQLLNIDFIWIHDAVTVLQSTLAHSLNSRGTKTIVVEMGIGMRITRAYGERLVKGIFALMRRLGMWDAPPAAEDTVSKPILSTEGEVLFINAECSGVIIPEAEHSSLIKKGQGLCKIVSPFEGKILQDVHSQADGFLFTMRTYPIVYEGSLIARIFRARRGGE